VRFLRLDLLRYGPFTGRSLTLRPGAKLHLIYGPNEAGKSSSLAAVGDLLFGFSKRKEYDFVHEASSLRVGAEIASRSGDTLVFRRRRGKKKTLLADDEAETALQEDALAPFIGNLNREVFSRAFGLDSGSLRQGGEAMLESEGEMGAALFAAASGLTDLARVRRQLDSEADAIFSPRPSKDRSFYQALDRYDIAIAAERRNELKSEVWKTLVAEIAEIEQQLAVIKEKRTETVAGLARLQRLKVVGPTVVAMDQLEGALAALSDLPEVPASFIAECKVALEAADGASGQERLAAEEVATATAALESIGIDETVAARGTEITDLFSRKGDYASKLAERPAIETERDGFTATLTDLAYRLGIESADDVVLQLPPDATIAAARQLVDEGLELETAIATDEKRLAEEIAELIAQDETGDVDGLTEPKPWRVQLAALGPDLKELGEQSYIEQTLHGMEQKLRDGAARLVPRVGNIEALAEAGLPTREMIGEHRAIFEKILADRRDHMVRLETVDQQRHETEQRLGEVEQGGPVAYQETIGLVRADRDATFALLRGQLQRRGRLMTPGELAAKVTQFEEEIVEADRLADDALADAERMSRVAGHREQLAELDRQRPEIEAQLAELDARQKVALRDYADLFVPAGIAPMAPEAMIGWLGSVEDLLAVRRDVEALTIRITSLDGLAGQVHGALAAIAGNIGLAGAETMPPLALSRLINAALDEMTDRWASRRAADGARQAGRMRVGQLEDILSKARRRHKEWRQKLDAMLPELGIDPRTATPGVAAALGVWASVPDVSRERANRAMRLATISRDMEAFEQAVLDLAHDLAPALVDLPAHGLIDVLREQAETARAAKVRYDDARARLELAQTRLAGAQAAHETASVALDALAAMLPDGSDARADLSRLERRNVLRAELAERQRELEAHADGLDAATIRADLKGFDRNRAPFDAEDLERRRESLNAENDRLHAVLGQKLARRETYEAGTGSELAAFERHGAEAKIVAAARLWAVRKIAATMLGQAIEKHREAQSDPLVLRAGALFNILTGASFSGVVQDYGEDDQPRLMGVRKGGERVAIAAMSEGTRDQLYLALRLAYIEDYADHAEPMPFIGDDIFQTFDDERTNFGIKAFASSSALFQPILFTHHLSVVAIARTALGDELDYIEL